MIVHFLNTTKAYIVTLRIFSTSPLLLLTFVIILTIFVSVINIFI